MGPTNLVYQKIKVPRRGKLDNFLSAIEKIKFQENKDYLSLLDEIVGYSITLTTSRSWRWIQAGGRSAYWKDQEAVAPSISFSVGYDAPVEVRWSLNDGGQGGGSSHLLSFKDIKDGRRTLGEGFPITFVANPIRISADEIKKRDKVSFRPKKEDILKLLD